MARKLEKSSDRLEPREKNDAKLLSRAEAGRRLREAPDYVPTRGEVAKDLEKYGVKVVDVPKRERTERPPKREELVKDLKRHGVEVDSVPDWKGKDRAPERKEVKPEKSDV